jgi:anaerobic magnesium-protoporphyrin IX monomethyl ester cyclase
MEPKRILLVQPSFSYKNIAEEELNPPLWAIYMGTYLKEKGHTIKVFDRNIQTDYKDFEKVLHEYNPDYVGFSILTGRLIYDAIQLSKTVKELTGAKVVWGGVHPSLLPEGCLKEEYVDYVIRGEGEAAFSNLISGLMDAPGVNTNELAPLINIDDLPDPDYSLVDLSKYEAMTISTSRGCPFRCTYCINRGFYGKEGRQSWRGLSPERTIKLFTNLATKHHQKNFVIVDDNFTSNQQRTIQICEGIKKLKLRIYLFSRVNYMNEETVKALKQAGVFQIQFGLESGSQRVLDYIKKDMALEQAKNAVELCKKHGIMVDGSFMIGIPTETEEELKMTEEWIKQLKPDYCGLKVFHPYPGTELYDQCVVEGRFTPPDTLEGWAEISTMEANLNMSDIPTKTLVATQKRVESFIMSKGYTKKLVSMIKQGHLPSIKKVKRAVQHLLRLK